VDTSQQSVQLLLNKGLHKVHLLEEAQEVHVVEALNALQVEQEVIGTHLRVQRLCHLQPVKAQTDLPCTTPLDVKVNTTPYQARSLRHR
jgi:hypothetical protein